MQDHFEEAKENKSDSKATTMTALKLTETLGLNEARFRVPEDNAAASSNNWTKD
jgi:hypothetical protein